jgi:anti-anti-sigma factor
MPEFAIALHTAPIFWLVSGRERTMEIAESSIPGSIHYLQKYFFLYIICFMNSATANNSIIPGFDDEKDNSLKMTLEKVEAVESCLKIHLDGYIDTYNSQIFQRQIVKTINAGYRNLIFACAALNYVSSTGIGSFTMFLKMVKKLGGDVVLLELQPKVFDVFQLLGFARYFNIKTNMTEAVSFFQNGVQIENFFPKIFSCPICSKKLKAVRNGRFRCRGCNSILAVNGQGKVFLG